MRLGWSYDADKIAAAVARIESAGFKTSFDADRPALKGFWDLCKSRGITMTAAQFAEKQVTGTLRDPNCQRRGTCVQQGSERAIEDRHNTLIKNKAIIAKPCRIAGEIMYGFERRQHFGTTHPFGCGCGNCPDGLMGVQAAEFYTVHGAIPRANYSVVNVDLTKPREDLSIAWVNGTVPSELLSEASNHKILCHLSQEWNEYADAMAAEHWGWVCLQAVFGMSRLILDKFNCVLPDLTGPNYGHCTEACGIVVLPDHTNGFLMQQSWCKDVPKYPKTIDTINGPLEMRPGQYCVRQSVLEGLSRQRELISCDIPTGSVFR